MSYPPPEGYPPPAQQPTAAQPTVQYPVQPPAPPAAPGYLPALTQISGVPDGPAGDRRRSTVLVLAIAAALLLVFGGLMLGLYVNERGNLNDTKANLNSTRTDLSAQVQEQKALATSLQAKLAEAEERATDLDTQLTTTKTNMSDMKAQRDALVPCMRRIQDAFDAASNGDSSGVTRALRQARTACDKAEIKVDS